MSLPNELMPVGLFGTGAVSTGYSISRSLRFNSADSAYLSRTPASAGNRKTWTWAGWVKKCSSKNQILLSCVGSQSDTGAFFIDFLSDDSLRIIGWSTVWRKTTQVFRDPSAWYHIVVTFDSTQATAANRIRIYVNGSEVTTFSTNNAPAQNTDHGINQAALHEIGRYTISSAGYDYLNAYLADVHFIDGQALTPSSFTETDATTGQLIPKAFTGSYGSNGWKLSFSDNSTAAALGTDSSSNGNTWTVNNLSVSAGSGNDSLVDTPTSYGTDTGVGGEVRGNYCTWNPLSSTATLRNGNLDASATTYAYGTIQPSTGKWYFEGVVITAADIWIGVSAQPVDFTTVAAYRSNGQYYDGSTWSAYGSTYTTNDVISVAVDMDGGSITFYKNGVSQGAKTRSVAGKVFIFSGDTTGALTANFGQRPFAYTAPSGFKALNTANLPAPVVTKPSTVMDVKLYTGNGSTQTISGLGFSPDLAWFKRRDSANNHALFDAVRGAGKFLLPNDTGAEGTDNNSLISFDANGVTVGQSVSAPSFNISSGSYVAWAWDAGTTTVSNTQGSISSQVRANASAGFSVVTYTGTLTSPSNVTIGHGLGVAPSLIITKSRTASADRWAVFPSAALGANKYLSLNTTDSVADSVGVGGGAAPVPTSTVFYSPWLTGSNINGETFVAYCFAPVAGYSAFGSYTGNGSVDGSFTYLGFLPKLILIKRTDTTSNWTMLDTLREGYNVDNDPLYPNLSNAEGTTDLLDITSNGFKLRSTDASVNASGGTYIFAAWASNPFQYSRAR